MAPAHAGIPPVVLDVAASDPPGEIELGWTGGDPTFVIFRSGDPTLVGQPGTKIGESLERSFTDDPPAGAIHFYRVGMRTPTTPEVVTIELRRPNDDPVGRPLPVAGHWNTGRPSAHRVGWDPDYMMDWLEAGFPVIPGVYLRRGLAPREPAW